MSAPPPPAGSSGASAPTATPSGVPINPITGVAERPAPAIEMTEEEKEREAEKRRRREALLEVEKAKSDLQLKAEQMQPSIADGANCAGKLAVAEAKLRVIRARLADDAVRGDEPALPVAGGADDAERRAAGLGPSYYCLHESGEQMVEPWVEVVD